MEIEADLYKETKGGETLWYVDCADIPACTGRRRVFLVVDTTDSFRSQDNHRLFIRSLLERLARILDPQDVVNLWTMGERDPLLERERGQVPEHLVHDLIERLEPFNRGSWLAETVREIDARCERAHGSDWEDYLLILSDGAIHDAVAAPLPTWISRDHIFLIVPDLPGDGGLGVWDDLIRQWRPTLLDPLERPPQELLVDPGPETARAVYRFGPAPIVPVGTDLRVLPGNELGLCYLGGEEPEPRLGSATDSYPLTWTKPQDGYPPHAREMARIAELLLAPWDRDALESLETVGKAQVIHSCGKVREPQSIEREPPQRLRCAGCGGCLLVRGQEPFPISNQDQSRCLLFPLPLRAGALPEYREPKHVRASAYGRYREAGKEFLVLNFLPSVF